MGRILPAFYQFFDDAGDPLSLGWLRFLEPSTNNTDKNTFADENMTIPNANPMRLDAAGRMSDAFGSGKYRVISFKNDPDDESNPGEQVQVKDPVQAEGTITGGGGGFETWDNATTYQLNDIVKYNTIFYRSLIVDNLGNNPAIEQSAWEQIDFVRFWNPEIQYTVSELVYYDSNLFISLQTLNLNYIPTARLDFWRPVATGISNISFKDDDYEIGLGEIAYLFVLSSATLADKTFTLPPVSAAYDKFSVWIANDSDFNLSITPQGASDIWLEDPVIISKGALVTLQYSGATDHWYVTGSGPALGGQEIGTTTNPITTAHVDVLSIATSINLPDDIPLYFGDSNDIGLLYVSATPAFNINLAAGNSLVLNINSIDYWIFDSTGPILPGALNPLADIGASGSYINDIFCAAINLADAEHINFNSPTDLTIYHDTTNGYITCSTGLINLTSSLLADSIHLFFGTGQDLDIYHTGAAAFFENDTGSLTINNTSASAINFATNNAIRWIFDASGHLLPNVAATYDFGGTANEIRHIYQGDNCAHYFGSDQDMFINFTGLIGEIKSASNLNIGTSVATSLVFMSANTERWYIDPTGHFIPFLAATYDIGSTSNEIRHIYQGDDCYSYFGNSQSMYLVYTGLSEGRLHSSDILILDSNVAVYFETVGTYRWRVTSSGHFVPILDNTYTLGAAGLCASYVYYYNLSACSDMRIKKDIGPTLGLDFITQLDPISFRYDDTKVPETKSEKKRHGLSAQQVEEIAERIGVEFCGVHYNAEKDRYGLDYTQFIGPIVQAIKDLNDKINERTSPPIA